MICKLNSIDYQKNEIFVTAREGQTLHTLWCQVDNPEKIDDLSMLINRDFEANIHRDRLGKYHILVQ